MAKIVEKGSWPVAPPPDDPLQQEEREKQLEIVRYVQELADTVLKIKQILGDISQMASPPTLPVPAVVEDDMYEEEEEEEEEEGDAMDVDNDGSMNLDAVQSRRRRRRVEDNSAGTTGVVAAQGTPRHNPDLPTREELDELLKRMEMIETKASDLTNEIEQHQSDVAQTFESEAEKVVEDYRAERQRKDDEEREDERKRVEAEIDRVNKESEVLGNDVEFLGGEVVGLIQKIEKLQFEVEQDKKERDIRLSKISQVRAFFILSSVSCDPKLFVSYSSLKNVSRVSNNRARLTNAPYRLSKQRSRYTNPQLCNPLRPKRPGPTSPHQPFPTSSPSYKTRSPKSCERP